MQRPVVQVSQWAFIFRIILVSGRQLFSNTINITLYQLCHGLGKGVKEVRGKGVTGLTDSATKGFRSVEHVCKVVTILHQLRRKLSINFREVQINSE